MGNAESFESYVSHVDSGFGDRQSDARRSKGGVAGQQVTPNGLMGSPVRGRDNDVMPSRMIRPTSPVHWEVQRMYI